MARRRTPGCARRRATARSRPRRRRSPPRAFGRLDPQTTTNVGRIEGGTASNVVAERCCVQCEARCIDHERAGAVATTIVDAMTEAAADRECDLEIDVAGAVPRLSRCRATAPPSRRPHARSPTCGIEPQPISPAAAATPTSSRRAASQCVNVANGTEARAPARRARDRRRARARCSTWRSGSSATARRERGARAAARHRRLGRPAGARG